MTTSIERFPVILRQLREQQGWSQEQLAERADLNRSYVGELERGRAMPSLATVGKLAEALTLSPSRLLAYCEQASHTAPPPSRIDGYSRLK